MVFTFLVLSKDDRLSNPRREATTAKIAPIRAYSVPDRRCPAVSYCLVVTVNGSKSAVSNPEVVNFLTAKRGESITRGKIQGMHTHCHKLPPRICLRLSLQRHRLHCIITFSSVPIQENSVTIPQKPTSGYLPILDMMGRNGGMKEREGQAVGLGAHQIRFMFSGVGSNKTRYHYLAIFRAL
jgi:hypothetical protein